MKRLRAPLALIAAVLAWAVPALARDFVQDQAQMFSPAVVAQLNQQIGSFNAQTGKEVLVVTVPSLNGASIATAAQQTAQQQNLNGVLIYIAKAERQDFIIPGSAEVQAGWFTADTTTAIRQSMEAQFKAEDYDGGITAAVNGILNVYRSHLGSLQNRGALGAPVRQSYATSGTGVHISNLMWILFIVVGFLIVRSIMRAGSNRYYGGGVMPPGQGGPPAGGPGYGGPGYGGYGGGGGSFWSGMLGGLGGAWLGNEMFGGNRGGGMLDSGTAQAGGLDNGGGWGNDMGQTGLGGSSGGDWGGGGFGDMGGGGGDSGGGW